MDHQKNPIDDIEKIETFKRISFDKKTHNIARVQLTLNNTIIIVTDLKEIQKLGLPQVHWGLKDLVA
jgi:hypothetical protein